MNQQVVLDLAREALQVTFMVSGPMLVVSLVIGIMISIIQVVTSIQDMTLTFVPKVLAVFLTFLIAFPWIMEVMQTFTSHLYGNLDRFIR